MKKIVMVRSNGIDPDSRVEKEANSLVKAGYEVSVLAWDRTRNYKIKIDNKKLADSCVKRISFGSKAGFGAGYKSLGAYLIFQFRMNGWLIKNRKQYDYVHLCDLDTAIISSYVCKILKKEFVFDIFDYLSTDAESVFEKLLEFFENHSINMADAVIICTEKRKQQIRKASPQKLAVIHNSPDYITLEPKRNQHDSKIRIVYVGILQPYRFIEELLQIVARNNDMELHIGGFGILEDMIKGMSMKHDNILYYGKLDYKDTLNLENKCDIITALYDPAIGNHKYAAPNKFYEALMLGKPLIMIKGSGMSEIVAANDIGVVVEPNEVSIENGLKELISARGKWKKIALTEKKLYAAKYSWEIMEKRLLGLYKELENKEYD
ncbi:MAG: glycosyltransferase family 4 protein [Muribaculaceae bacterium]|nr:glycosyltransferase family 4 protein [Roseburia sp.]MCM1432029.1 glycosyltransferase family 4 protein [Muribaculaceae bacterium]MCM1493718.1 glycosyltransferase family 4 protein [Muribaculaceae bacterium]